MGRVFASPVGSRMIWIGLCASIIGGSLFSQGVTLVVLLAVVIVIMVSLALRSRGKRWAAIRSILGCFAFAISSILAWKGHQRAYAIAGFAIVSVLLASVGVIQFQTTDFGDGREEEQAGANGGDAQRAR